jgi:hypothetical protein
VRLSYVLLDLAGGGRGAGALAAYQARKTKHTLGALRDLSTPRALVRRNGQQQRIRAGFVELTMHQVIGERLCKKH